MHIPNKNILCLLALGFCACSDRALQVGNDLKVERDQSGAILDGGTQKDGPAGLDTPAPLHWTFVPDSDQGAPQAVWLQLESLQGDLATLQIVVKGVATLQGIAFRLSFDPQAIEIVQGERGQDWPNQPASVSAFAIKPKGELWAGLGFKNHHGLDASAPTIVAKTMLRLRGPSPAALKFRAARNLLIDPKGQPIAVSWLGGVFLQAP
jgi:hypothetical protein